MLWFGRSPLNVDGEEALHVHTRRPTRPVCFPYTYRVLHDGQSARGEEQVILYGFS